MCKDNSFFYYCTLFAKFFCNFAANLSIYGLQSKGIFLKANMEIPILLTFDKKNSYGKRIKRSYQACRELQSMV